MKRELAKGALLGLAVGDALGTTYEFERIDQPPYPTLATGPATDIVGAGPFNLVAGQITDDTQLAVCLARSLAERGRHDVDDVARRYVAWIAHAFDIGNQTRASLDRIENGVSPREAAIDVWRRSNRQAAGNGSLMRIAPLAVAYAGRDDLAHAAVDESLITHADPRCALACAAYCFAIAGRDPRAGLAEARDYLKLESVDQAAAEIASDLDPGADPGVYVDGLHLHRTAGFVRVALRLAFWHARHTASWRDAVVDVASRGGDADTNTAIVGALLGARDGIGAIPIAWIERVLAVTQPGPADWAEAHHPRHLLGVIPGEIPVSPVS